MDKALFGLSVQVMPFVIGILSVLALLFWQPWHEHADAASLRFHAVEEPAPGFTPHLAQAQLAQRPLVARLDTRLSEKPFWFLFTVAPGSAATDIAVELPSRHAVQVSCWNARDLTSLGHADRQSASGHFSQVKAGFALDLGRVVNEFPVLCQASFVGPARLTLQQWAVGDLQRDEADFARKSGLLDGGLLVLSLFVFLTAMINRNRTYVLFAVWLVLNLRLGALSAGWDIQWLSALIPVAWIERIRSVTLALHYVITLTLFQSLFREELPRIGGMAIVRLFQWTCILLLFFATVLPYAKFLPVLWIFAGAGIFALVYLLVRIVRLTRSAVAVWYSASLAVTLFASFYEVISAALGIEGFIGSINSVTAALSSSLLASLAIAIQMRAEHEEKLRAQAALQHTYDVIPIGLFALDLRGRFLSANPALRDMLGIDVLVPDKCDWQFHFSNEDWLLLLDLAQHQDEVELELEAKSRLGRTDAQRFLVKATLAGDRIEGSLQDVTEKARAIARLQFLAHHDPLTNALNRTGIELALERATKQLDAGKPLALAYLDLDRFKLINDLYGHTIGDEVLRQVGRRVHEALPHKAQLGRVGGDEFIILLSDMAIKDAASICREVVKCIADGPYRVGERSFHVQGSVGVVEMTPGHSIKDIVSAADRACGQAKRSHDGGCVVYEKTSTALFEHEEEMRLVEQLSITAVTAALYLEMQPIMSLKAPSESLSFEVLLRMRDAQGKQIPTERLIAAAEHSGSMGVIDRWVVQTTMDWIRTHAQQLTNTRFVCVNLNGSSLNDERFVRDIYAMLEANSDVASRLCLEITESVALQDIERTREFVDRIRGYGAKVALDDFGAGYTSFTYLMGLPSDLLKIDGSFVVNINHHPANVAIVEAIVNLSRNLGMKTIAEWAEDCATVQTLAELGVDYVQGFVVSRPQDPVQLLTANSSAAFIQDAELTQFVRLLDAEGLFGPAKSPFPGEGSNQH